MRIYFLVGEDSGDMHGSNLIHALIMEFPQAQFRGMGGDRMREAGMQLVRHVSETNFMGFVEVARNIGSIRKMFRDVQADILHWKPDLLICVDYPGFNLRMARFAHENGIKVIYYILPQLWAWKKGRIGTLRKYTDLRYPILPFEDDFYQKEKLEVRFLGHPLLDEAERFRHEVASIRAVAGLDNRPVIAILPGSRMQEIRNMLPAMLEATKQFPDYQFLLGAAPAIPETIYRKYMQAAGVQVPMLRKATYAVLSVAEAAMVTSGTATLETALFGVPQVVCYKAGAISVWIARRLVGGRVKYISLVNLIADAPVVKELIQEDMTTSNICTELKNILSGAAGRSVVEDGYRKLREKLGNSGVSNRIAADIAQWYRATYSPS